MMSLMMTVQLWGLNECCAPLFQQSSGIVAET